MNKIWIHDLRRGTDRRLSNLEGNEGWAVVAPSGRHVAFAAHRNGSVLNVFRRELDGGEREERLTTSEYHQFPQCFSPDGSVLALVEERPARDSRSTYIDILLLPLNGDRKPRPLFNTAVKLRTHPAFSPDGRWIAYVSDEAGQRMEIYVVAYPQGGPSFQITSTGGIGPLWAPDGRELYYRRGPSLMAVPFRSESPDVPQRPSVLFTRNDMMDDYGWGLNYDIAPDGRRFLMLKRIMPEFRQINVVQNWFEELKRLVPTGKR
jgi:Tol biopolymer transport system component